MGQIKWQHCIHLLHRLNSINDTFNSLFWISLLAKWFVVKMLLAKTSWSVEKPCVSLLTSVTFVCSMCLGSDVWLVMPVNILLNLVNQYKRAYLNCCVWTCRLTVVLSLAAVSRSNMSGDPIGLCRVHDAPPDYRAPGTCGALQIIPHSLTFSYLGQKLQNEVFLQSQRLVTNTVRVRHFSQGLC